MDFTINLSIIWILSSWELQSAFVVAEQNASSFIFIIYAIACYIKKEYCFIAVFFLDDMLCNVSMLDSLHEYQYYLVTASIYCALYWYAERRCMKLETIIACGIIVLFNAGMSIDAIINKESNSFLYENYIFIVVFIYLYLISTLFSWTLIGKSLGNYIRDWSRTFSLNYNLAFICYAIKKKVIPSETK